MRGKKNLSFNLHSIKLLRMIRFFQKYKTRPDFSISIRSIYVSDRIVFSGNLLCTFPFTHVDDDGKTLSSTLITETNNSSVYTASRKKRQSNYFQWYQHCDNATHRVHPYVVIS